MQATVTQATVTQATVTQATVTYSIDHNSQQEQHYCYRIERQYSSQRPLRELVLDLLRAHSGE